MSKTKKSVIPHYELLYIVSNEYTEEELKPITEKVKGFITNNGGTITFEEQWGKKKLAYKIKQFTYGYYNLVEFDLEGENLKSVDKLLRMSTDIVRFMIVAREKRTVEEIEAQKKKEKEYRDAHRNAAMAKKEEKMKESVKKTFIEEEKEAIVEEESVKEEKIETEIEEKEPVKKVERKKKTEEKEPVKKEEKKDVKKKKKMDLDDLDEKLDKILETNDLL